MDDIVRNNVNEIAGLLSEHKGEDTVIIDISEECSWTDFFVITTVRSQAHQAGLLRHLHDFFKAKDLTPLNKQKSLNDTGWILLDCGEIIIHLMEKEQRQFYELEKLWFKGKLSYLS